MTAEPPPATVAVGEPRWFAMVVEGVVIGALGAVVALAFVGLVAAGERGFWPDELGTDLFSGSIRILVMATVSGVLVGMVHRVDRNAREVNVFEALAGGELDRRAVPGGVLIALIAAVGGISLGPEVATGMAAGGFAAWLSDRRGRSGAERATAVGNSVTGAWSGLFTAPAMGVLFNLELGIGHRRLEWARVLVDAAAALTGFAVFFAVTQSWSTTLRILDLGTFTLSLWHLPVAAAIGLVGAVVGAGFAAVMAAMAKVAGRLADRPVLRCGVAGLALGLLGMALPLVPFLGTEGLRVVTEDAADLAVGLLVASALAKLVATATALSFGFVGGPIFPMIFSGGTLGTALHVLVPDVPLALAVPAGMVAVPATVLPIPLSLTILVGLIASLTTTELVPVFTAAFTASAVGRALAGRESGADDHSK